MQKLKVLVGCEESQAVCKAFRELGHEAYSCDLQECSGGHPEWHIVADVLTVVNGGWFKLQNGDTIYIEKWDLGIFHPVCRYLANSGVKNLVRGNTKINPDRWIELKKAMVFFNKIKQVNIPKVAIENPIPHIYAKVGLDSENNTTYFGDTPGIMGYNQIIQPWMFGHKEMKATCLWLNGLPKLFATDVVGPPPKDKKERKKWAVVHRMAPGPERAKLRSKTYTGIAKAMADQWTKESMMPICKFKETNNDYNTETPQLKLAV